MDLGRFELLKEFGGFGGGGVREDVVDSPFYLYAASATTPPDTYQWHLNHEEAS